MPKKALEVFTWMQGEDGVDSGPGSGVDPDDETYDEMLRAVERARRWDDSIGLGATVDKLRPAPFDGMRMLYMENYVEKTLDERLAEIKLGEVRVFSVPPPLASP
eukprot:621972-Prorocentrum_minimum.AAC.1